MLFAVEVAAFVEMALLPIPGIASIGMGRRVRGRGALGMGVVKVR